MLSLIAFVLGFYGGLLLAGALASAELAAARRRHAELQALCDRALAAMQYAPADDPDPIESPLVPQMGPHTVRDGRLLSRAESEALLREPPRPRPEV